MALGALTITIKVNAVDKILKRINQDNFATRYFLHEPTQDFTVNIRHSKETSGGVKFDRHNVEIIQEVFPTALLPGITRTAYFVLRNSGTDDYDAAGYIGTALADLLKVTGNMSDLTSWVS
jgi:hypothetical protein